MDFKKIRNIFIAAFLLLNIFLVYSYYNRYNVQNTSTTNNQIDVLAVMEQSGIELPEFENNEPEIYSMQANQQNLLQEEASELPGQTGSIEEDGSYYASLLSNLIELEGNMEDGYTEDDMETLNSFVESSRVLFGDQYEYGWTDQSNNRIVYLQTVDGYPVSDGTSEISLYTNDNGDVFSYQQTFAGPMNQQGSSLGLITDQEAVENLFRNNEIPSNSTVQSPILSYHGMLRLENLSMYSPVWIVPVQTSNGITRHRVNATNGQIIQQGSQQSGSSEEETGNNSDSSRESTEGESGI